MSTITVLTPTYNRQDKLIKLYQSLCDQSYRDFEWLVIDDGSTDQTLDLLARWQEKAEICLRFFAQENGGKHRAVNRGVREITSPLTFIVDSDDWLTADALDIVQTKYRETALEEDLCGWSFLRIQENGDLLSPGKVAREGQKSTFVDCRIRGNLEGDMAEVWRTDCLRRYPFPEIEGERFLGEDVVWVQMSGPMKLRFYNDPIYCSAYLEDGLTNNRRRHNIGSPQGCLYRAEVMLRAGLPPKQQLKAILQYGIYGWFAGYQTGELLKRSEKKGLFLLSLPAAGLLYRKWKREAGA